MLHALRSPPSFSPTNFVTQASSHLGWQSEGRRWSTFRLLQISARAFAGTSTACSRGHHLLDPTNRPKSSVSPSNTTPTRSWTSGGGAGSSTNASKAVGTGDVGYWKIKLSPTTGAPIGVYDHTPYSIQFRFVADTTGTITGYVHDAQNGNDGRLRGVTVTVDGTSLSAITDATGSYRIDNAPAGARTVRVDRGVTSCYQVAAVPVTVPAGSSVEADIPVSVNTAKDIAEPNDTWESASTLTSGATVNPYLRFVHSFYNYYGYTDDFPQADEDTYSISVTGPGTLRLEVSNLPVTCHFYFQTPSGYGWGGSWTTGGSDGSATTATKSVGTGDLGVWKVRIVPAGGVEGTYDTTPYTIKVTRP